MSRNKRRGMTGLVACLCVATRAEAHLMPPQQGTVNVLGDSVFSVVAVPASALHGADDSGDGRLSNSEVAAHESSIQAQIGARFRLYGLGAAPHAVWRFGTHEFVSVGAEHDESLGPEVSQASPNLGVGARHILVLLKTRFTGEQQAIRLETDLFGSAAGEGELTIRATHGKEADVGVLRGDHGTHVFFQATSQPIKELSGLRTAVPAIAVGVRAFGLLAFTLACVACVACVPSIEVALSAARKRRAS